MRRAAAVLVCLFLVLAGLCTGVCLAQVSGDNAGHGCCHEKNHCGHGVATAHSHPAIVAVHIAPAPAARLLASIQPAATVEIALPAPGAYVPSLRILVLRL